VPLCNFRHEKFLLLGFNGIFSSLSLNDEIDREKERRGKYKTLIKILIIFVCTLFIARFNECQTEADSEGEVSKNGKRIGGVEKQLNEEVMR
jgi:hypothetical protein